jgi:hypothetical protein
MRDLACAKFRNCDVLSLSEKVDQVRRESTATVSVLCFALNAHHDDLQFPLIPRMTATASTFVVTRKVVSLAFRRTFFASVMSRLRRRVRNLSRLRGEQAAMRSADLGPLPAQWPAYTRTRAGSWDFVARFIPAPTRRLSCLELPPRHSGAQRRELCRTSTSPGGRCLPSTVWLLQSEG